MKIYTRRGDGGETSLLGGVRVWKNSLQLDVIGTLDELNAEIGLLRAEHLPEEIDQLLERLQNELFYAGTELAASAPSESPCSTISENHIQGIEAAIDQFDSKLHPLGGFVLPGGVRSAAMFHVVRTICRRAERHLVSLVQSDKQAVSDNILAYINRLSDLFFVLARLSNAQAGVGDVLWTKS
jgi:cob(I)alamin adenosyltransferase